MDIKYTNKKKGIIKSLLLIVAAVILIAYFRNDIKAILESARVKDAIVTGLTWIQKALIWLADKLGWTSDRLK